MSRSRLTIKVFVLLVMVGIALVFTARPSYAWGPKYTGYLWITMPDGVTKYRLGGILLKQKNHWRQKWDNPTAGDENFDSMVGRNATTDSLGYYKFDRDDSYACGSGKIAWGPTFTPSNAQVEGAGYYGCTGGIWLYKGYVAGLNNTWDQGVNMQFPYKEGEVLIRKHSFEYVGPIVFRAAGTGYSDENWILLPGGGTHDSAHPPLVMPTGVKVHRALVYWKKSNDGGRVGANFEWVPMGCSSCGNGIIDADEQCDDGNTTDGDGCSSTCYLEAIPSASISGDILLKKGETGRYDVSASDLLGNIPLDNLTVHYRRMKNADGSESADKSWGQFFGSPFSCSGVSCQYDQIGLNTVDLASGFYEVVVNAHSSVSGVQCTGNPDCDSTKAGRGELACWDWLDCDPDRPPDVERDYLELRVTECGNGVVESGEDCDGEAGCGTDCKWTSCGDGILQTPNSAGFNEECDDGEDNNNAKACNVNCLKTYCGDGIVQKPNGKGINLGDSGFFESCDDGGNLDGDGCSSDCQDEGQPWLRTEGGDVFSKDGFSIEGMPSGLYLSSYLCLTEGGVGSINIGGGCSLQGGNWELINMTDATRKNVNAEFIKMRDKLNELFGGGNNFSENGINGSKHLTGGLPSQISGKNIHYFVNDLTISEDINYQAGCTEESCGALVFVEGNLTIEHNVRDVFGFFIVGKDARIKGSSDLIPLKLDGGMISLGHISPERTLGTENETKPAELIIHDPRYIDMLRILLGELGAVQFVESGTY